MAKVVYLDCETTLDIPPDRVLEAAVGQLESCIVIGRNKEGKLYLASSMGDNAHTLWDMKQAEKFLLDTE